MEVVILIDEPYCSQLVREVQDAFPLADSIQYGGTGELYFTDIEHFNMVPEGARAYIWPDGYEKKGTRKKPEESVLRGTIALVRPRQDYYVEELEDLEWNSLSLRRVLPNPGEPVALDTETVGLEDITLLGLSISGVEKRGLYIPLRTEDDRFQIRGLVSELAGRYQVIWHNAPFDLRAIGNYSAYSHDTRVMAWLLSHKVQSLEGLTKEVLGVKHLTFKDLFGTDKVDVTQLPLEQLAIKSCGDVDHTLQLFNKFKPQLESWGMWSPLYTDLELPLIPILMKMKDRGIEVHVERRKQLRGELNEQLDRAGQVLVTLGMDFDRNSYDQMSDYLFNKRGFPILKATGTGRPSTDEWVLKQLEHLDPAITLLLMERGLQKQLSTFLGSDDEVVHASFNQCNTETGRLSCVPLDSEILTVSGWKTYDQLTVGEKVLGYDLLNDEVRPTDLLGVYVGKKGTGDLYWRHGKSIQVGVSCTPDHRWVIKRPGFIGLAEAEFLSQHRGHGWKLLTAALAKGGTAPFTPTEAGVIGWGLTDAWVRRVGSRFYCNIEVSKPSSIAALRTLLKEVPHSDRDQPHRSTTRFYIEAGWFNELWQRFLKYSNPTAFVIDLNTACRDALWVAMMEADGSTKRLGGGRPQERFGAAKKPVIDAFETLAALRGRHVRYRERHYENNRPDFTDIELSEPYHGWPRYSGATRQEQVWCPTTETGTWIMRQRGSIVITGNCTAPNLQQVPEAFRSIYRAREGYVLVGADYQQMEMRIMAHTSRDPTLVEGYRTPGWNIHEDTMKRLGVNKRLAKAINFGIPYGAEEYTISEKAGLSMEEAKYFLNLHRSSYPILHQHMAEEREFALANGYMRTLPPVGRVRQFPDLRLPGATALHQKALREAVNMPIQGTNADITKAAMVELDSIATDYGAHLLLQIHDELVYEVPEGVVEEWVPIQAEKMTRPRIRPEGLEMKVDVHVGKYWSELK